MPEDETETTDDLIKGTEEAKQAAEAALDEAQGEAQELEEELARRATGDQGS